MTIGIDVGGPAKGFHAVAICGQELIDKRASADAPTIARWCSEIGALVVAVDAPCHWRRPGERARFAERALAAERISCFSTPTFAKARGHAFYTWMFTGADLFASLHATHPLYNGSNAPGPLSVETFPQAVACALAGKRVSAKQKLAVRSALLEATGFARALFANIDEIDAALCALAADAFARNQFKAYGDAEDGFIIVPQSPVASSVSPKVPARTSVPSVALSTVLRELPQLTEGERAVVRGILDRTSVPKAHV